MGKSKKIAVMGYGVVGSGVVEVFYKNYQTILKNAGCHLDIKYILDLRDFENSPYADKFIKDFQIILNDKEIDIVVEVMGGLTPAYDFVNSCLAAGKSVVTSNKELVAAKGAQLLETARKHNVNFFFEASVGGGIPIMRPLHTCLAANEIIEIAGILNGTTNFILTKMIRDGVNFADALHMAQDLGYAERNPTADIEGHDACRKICILASLAFGKHVYPHEVFTQGIVDLSLQDVQNAGKISHVIKLIGRAARLEDGKIMAMVSPALVNAESQLSRVDDVFNAVLVKGNAVGDVIFYGKGAGKLPTASAVVADIIAAAKTDKTDTSLYWEDRNDDNDDYVVDYYQTEIAYYARVAYHDNAKALISQFFGKVDFIPSCGQYDDLAFVTSIMQEDRFAMAVQQLECAGVAVKAKIRVLNY